MIQTDNITTSAQPQGRPSRRGVWLRELIAAGVKATGGDIIAVGKKHERSPHLTWLPPRGWKLEKVNLTKGALGQFLTPKNSTRTDAAVLQIHGGGYTLGFLPIFQRRSTKLARLAGRIPVFSLDYRVAPEHPYPAALDDSLQAVEWLKRVKGIPPESVIAIGESAGAGLILALSMLMRDKGIGSFRAIVLMSPWADLTCTGDSYAARYYMDPMFGRILPPPADDMRTTISEVYAAGHDLKEPYLSPVFGDFSGLPPMLIHVGEYEMLHDDAAAVYSKAIAAGSKAEFKEWPGMFHAFQLADALIPEAKTAWREIGSYMRRYLA